MDPMVPDVMNDFFAQPRAGFLRVFVCYVLLVQSPGVRSEKK